MKYILLVIISIAAVSCGTTPSTFQAVDEDNGHYIVSMPKGYVLDEGEEVCIRTSSYTKGWELDIDGAMKDTSYVITFGDSITSLIQYRIVNVDYINDEDHKQYLNDYYEVHSEKSE